MNLIARDFSKAAKTYEAEATLQQRVLKTIAAQVAQLPKDALVLDAGCATGVLSTLIPQRVVGVDIAFGMCKNARMSVVNADICALPFADGVFDCVVSNFVLQWVEHPARALAEFARVLKKGGVAHITSFGPATLQELKPLGLAVNGFAPLEQLVNAAEAAGFRVQQAASEIHTMEFDSTLALMRHLRAIGANAKTHSRTQLTKAQCQRSLHATFEVLKLKLTR